MARNWMADGLRRASFRGVDFWVEKDSIETGRRLVVHEFPHRDVPYVEDMGRATNKIQITAYVSSDSSDSEARSLMQACEARGAASLQLPLEKLRAHCEKASRDFERDKLGYIAFSLSFVREGSSAGLAPAAYLSRITSAAVPVAAAATAELMASRFATVGAAGFVRQAAAVDIENIAGALEAVRAVMPIEPIAAPAIARQIQDLHDNAETLAVAGSVGGRWEKASYLDATAGAEEVPLIATRVIEVFAAIGEATEPGARADALVDLMDYGLTPDNVTGVVLTPSRARLEANRAALATMVRALALVHWAAAKAEVLYPDRRSAIQARADVAERIDAELERLTGGDAYRAYLALLDVRDKAVAYLSTVMTTLAPVLAVGAPRRMPSLWWAHRLYGDATRAGELVGRNRVIHAAFMPTEFEALAK